MAENNRYDIIIIGTGAGGGTLAYHLAPSGKRILLLERGGYLPREKDNWDAKAVFVESKYRAKETWYDKDGKPFYPGIQYYVGGNTKVYGAALLRFRERDFDEVGHHGGLSPAWPLSYADFEPYYTKAEHLYHVHGQHGIDPTEGPASAPYRYPPVSHAPRIQELCNDFERLGYHPFPLPLGILLDEADGKALHTSACVRCAAFDGFPCLVNGKADSQVIGVDPALAHSNVELLTRTYVERLETDASGRVVTRVICNSQWRNNRGDRPRVRSRLLATSWQTANVRSTPCDSHFPMIRPEFNPNRVALRIKYFVRSLIFSMRRKCPKA